MITHRKKNNSSLQSNYYANGGACILRSISLRHRAQSKTELHFQISIDSSGRVCVRSTYFLINCFFFFFVRILQCMLITGFTVVGCCFQFSVQIDSTIRVTEGIILFAQEIADQIIYGLISTNAKNNVIRTNQKIP